jgi:hypothetical protein
MKATKTKILARAEEILRIRLDGAQFWDVREYVREKEREPDTVWTLPDGAKPLSDPTLWRYIAKADKLIAESCRSSRKKLLRRHLAQRRNLYAKAVSQGDIKAALAVLRDEAELLALYPPAEVAPTAPDGERPPMIQFIEVVRPVPREGEPAPDLAERNGLHSGERATPP